MAFAAAETAETKEQSPFDTLTEFVPELVSGFDPEKSSDATIASKTLNNSLFMYGQHKDMLNAYLYAQAFLMQIREMGITNITTTQVRDTIMQIHRLICKALAADHDFTPGEFSQGLTFRFHMGSDTLLYIVQHFEGMLSREQTINTLVELGYVKKTAKSFLEMLARYKQLVPAGYPAPSEILTNELASDYHANRLSAKERKVVEEICVINQPPAELPRLLDEFIEQFLVQWKACDAADPEQVVNLAYYVFYELTERHVFSNANGRTATCFMNLVLRSLGKASILVRHPFERYEKASSYAQAIDNIKIHPEMLKEHLRKRIFCDVPYQNLLLNQIMKFKLKVFDLLEACVEEYVHEDVDLFFSQLSEYTVFAHIVVPPKPSREAIANNPSLIPALIEQINMLQQFLVDPSAATAVLLVKVRALQVARREKSQAQHITLGLGAERAPVVDKIKALTQEIQVIFPKKGEFTILINVANKERADTLIVALNATAALIASFKGNPERPVVFIHAINPELVMAIDKLEFPRLAKDKVERYDFQPGD